MQKQKKLEVLKEKIRRKKIQLNNLAKDSLNEYDVVKLSKELDILINEYHLLEYKEILDDKKS